MKKVIISDTSCLIALDNIGKLDLLASIFTEVFTTNEVQKEFGKPVPKWISILKVENTSAIQEINKILDLGESSAIALALEIPNSVLIIDEKKGRKIAKEYNVEIIGTLKVILIAKKLGKIASVESILNDLNNVGFRYSKKVLELLLKQAEE